VRVGREGHASTSEPVQVPTHSNHATTIGLSGIRCRQRWRSQHGGTKANDMKSLTEVEKENLRLMGSWPTRRRL
jgi:hypothetical protein